MAVKVCTLTVEEAQALNRLAYARRAPHRLVQRFNRHGLAGLADAARPRRPRRHDETARGTVVAPVRPKP